MKFKVVCSHDTSNFIPSIKPFQYVYGCCSIIHDFSFTLGLKLIILCKNSLKSSVLKMKNWIMRTQLEMYLWILFSLYHTRLGYLNWAIIQLLFFCAQHWYFRYFSMLQVIFLNVIICSRSISKKERLLKSVNPDDSLTSVIYYYFLPLIMFKVFITKNDQAAKWSSPSWFDFLQGSKELQTRLQCKSTTTNN